MEITFLDERFCCWGHSSQGGTYLLRLTVSRSLAVKFGRFLAGEPIIVSQGDYLYVGSALAQKGATSLARRLLRHASRSDVTKPQPIRQEMLELFPKIGLGPSPLLPPTGKKLRWHVDFLLDEPAAELTAAYLMRFGEKMLDTELHRDQEKKFNTSAKSGDSLPLALVTPSRQIESAVARWLLASPEVSPLVPGLGATDDPGGTHLLCVTADSSWWRSFPNHLSDFLRGVPA